MVIIVIIAILAAITIVSYDIIRGNAQLQIAKTDAQSVAVQVNHYKAESGGYPSVAEVTSLAGTLAKNSQSVITYIYNAGPNTFCVSASYKERVAHATNVSTEGVEGACP